MRELGRQTEGTLGTLFAFRGQSRKQSKALQREKGKRAPPRWPRVPRLNSGGSSARPGAPAVHKGTLRWPNGQDRDPGAAPPSVLRGIN